MTSVPVKFREDKYTLLFGSPNTNNDFLPSRPKVFNTAVKSFVLGVLKDKSSKTSILSSLAL